ncbi:type II toxin-antitoxin system HicA family toxin [Patescibacteria group bacterium]|nr:type II toxin-antitoxin system HicA family toxin [Patescibacteria group bacterium]MBU4481406.1 type II toxin-antitoxin system HicA family toxin [Patescibacteria group bacterium]
MPKLKPVSWRELMKRLRRFGFEGPYQVGKHPYMIKGNLTLTIPNPHSQDISPDLILRILKQAEINKEDWVDEEG